LHCDEGDQKYDSHFLSPGFCELIHHNL
jgi:hypothetical protein